MGMGRDGSVVDKSLAEEVRRLGSGGLVLVDEPGGLV